MPLKDKTPAQVAALYTSQNRKLLARFRAWLDADPERSIQSCAKMLGCSSSTLSRLLSRKYPGNVDRICESMRRMMVREALRRRVPRRPPYVETSISERVEGALELAHLESVMAVVLGPTGIGKTMAATHYCEHEANVLYIVAGPAATKYALIRTLSSRLGLSWHGSMYDMRDVVIGALRDTGRLLVIDEADYLREDALQILRIIHDGAGVGMVLVGTLSFVQRLRERKSSTINQVLGRVAYCEILPSLQPDDLEKLAGQYQLDKAAMAALVEGASGQARRAAAALVTAQRMNGQDVTAKALKAAYRRLMPVLHNGFNGR